jgi:predicted house-cleaning noncanonical NTP pyrophosphatase (MazG superfamily)
MGKRLVRDRALEHWVVPGAEHQVRPVKDFDEHQQLLRSKLLEEAGEVIFADPEGLLKELADVFEVLRAIGWTNGITMEEVTRKAVERTSSGGGFDGGMVWETGR